MSNIGRTVATLAVWGGTALLAHVFHEANILSSSGAGWMTVAAFVTTLILWCNS